MKKRKILALVAAATVALLALGACSQGDDGAASVRAARAPEQESGNDLNVQRGVPVANADVPQDQFALDSAATQPALQLESAAALPDVRDRIIKTATLRIEVEKGTFRQAVQSAIGIAGARGGFVFSSAIDDKKEKRGTVVISVPSGAFERALKDAETLGDVVGQDITGEDVSQEFVDLSSRLRNSEAQEQVLLRLYDRATSVADTIRIQREVEDVQLEIERIRGRIRFLENKTSMSTITLDLTEAGAALTKAAPQGMLARAWERAVGAALAVVSAGIVFAGAVFPIAVLLALLLVGVRLLRPRFSPEG